MPALRRSCLGVLWQGYNSRHHSEICELQTAPKVASVPRQRPDGPSELESPGLAESRQPSVQSLCLLSVSSAGSAIWMLLIALISSWPLANIPAPPGSWQQHPKLAGSSYRGECSIPLSSARAGRLDLKEMPGKGDKWLPIVPIGVIRLYGFKIFCSFHDNQTGIIYKQAMHLLMNCDLCPPLPLR